LLDSASSPMLRCGSLVRAGASYRRAGGLGAGVSASGRVRAAGAASTMLIPAGGRPDDTGGEGSLGLEGAAVGAVDATGGTATGLTGVGASRVETAASCVRAGDTGALAGAMLVLGWAGAGVGAGLGAGGAAAGIDSAVRAAGAAGTVTFGLEGGAAGFGAGGAEGFGAGGITVTG